GLDVHLVLTGPPPAPGAEGPNQALDELLGATVHVTAGEDRSERAALAGQVAADLRAQGRRPFVIDVGGTGATGVAGQVLAGLELAEQLSSRGIGEVTVVLPTATGGTQAGVLAGLILAAPPTRAVVGVAVASPAAEIASTVQRLVSEIAPLIGVGVPSSAIVVDGDQLGEGYGRPTEAATEATQLLARTEGILVDPIYTAKALADLVARVRDGRLGGPVVFWHAGGTPGLFERL
ncbi:MAG TPA: pyridoxal-phosphate dependent enzyme, partial [Candidatus Limnocylindrales bacterium]